MQLQVFTVAALGGDAQMEEVNAFLRGHRVASVDRYVVHQAGIAYWTFSPTTTFRSSTTG